MKIQSQFLLACVSRAIDAAEDVLPLFEKKYPKDDRPRRAIDLAKQWRTLMQQGKEAQAKQMEQQLRNAAVAADAAAAAFAAHAAHAVHAAHAAAHAAANAPYAAANVADAAAFAVAYAKEARGSNWLEAREAELQWQNEEAARTIVANKGEILWGEDAAIFLMGEMNLWMRGIKIHMIEAREALL